jgi:flagellin
MALRLNTNLAALNTAGALNRSSEQVSASLERLSSTLRLNRAADDAAGLSVREGLRAELAGLEANVRNVEQATDLIQTAEGSLNEVNSVLLRLRQLATQSSNSTLTNSNRESIQSEFGQLVQEVDRIAQSTTFNNQVLLTGFGNQVDAASTALAASPQTGVTGVILSGTQAATFTFIDNAGDGQLTLGNGTVSQTVALEPLLDGGVVATGTQVVVNFDRLGIQLTLAGAQADNVAGQFADGDLDGRQLIVSAGTGGSFQVGPTDTVFNRIEVSIVDLRASGTELNLGTAGVADIASARQAIAVVDQAAGRVARQRGDLGAVQNRLSFTLASSENAIENIQASEGSISDADIARQVTELARAQLLTQLGTSLLAQTHIQQQNVLTLLGVGQGEDS